ncbi:crotonase/enoyl-CoA hydratase family protein [Rubrivivax rivuli]|uniref:Crotonase/enoyl-CoA hydratase family protein n=1 Tax=Rubrivivax rivuli TaxID=1862385 RepID=A0A437RE80_9BURK|nr:crotonase/enoyl-CoA hydratase family protein [Rubrivivax rivuli]RVU45065.1 crotonase/enoyl-CoA hydratase family protein [Rubrivivax rivuli]
MTLPFEPLADDAPAALRGLDLLRIERAGPVLHVRLNRPAKRNSVSDELLAQLHTVWLHIAAIQPEIKAALISGEGAHFCAGLDLSEVSERNVTQAVHHSRSWHACFDAIQYGPVPVIAVLHGAVVGGGLELASSAHIRVAEASSFYGLPEGTRGIFVGGGGSVRISRLIGVARMTDMMLTGRVFDAAEGQQHAISNYLVGDGEGLAKGLELANKIAGNAPLSNYAITQALPRIADLSASDGLFMEALIASIAQGDDAAKERVRAFLEKRSHKVAKS